MSKLFIPLLKTFLLFVLILYSFTAYSQYDFSDSLRIDSLEKVLLTQKDDTNKVNTLNEMSKKMDNTADYTNAINTVNKSVVLSEQLNFEKGSGDAYYQKGSILSDQYKYKEARVSLLKA